MASFIPEHVAKVIVRAALKEGRCGELLTCLIDGGSATIDATSGDLILADSEIIRQLREGTR